MRIVNRINKYLSLIETITNEFFPFLCLKCDEQIASDGLCNECWLDLEWIHSPNCLRCYRELKYSDIKNQICPTCEYKSSPLDGICSSIIYNDQSKSLILKFKNFERLEIAKWGATIMTKHLPQINFDYITPIPLHFFRFVWRGYNQAAELAREIACIKQTTYAELLLKIKNTKSQGLFQKIGREQNIKDSFQVNPKFYLKNKRVLLIDDVYTTGSTMNECARVLKLAGASQVFGASIAKT